MNPGPLHIRARYHRGAVLVQPVGVLDVTTYAELRSALIKCVADEPSAVIVDVADLTVPAPYALSLFSTVGLEVAEWPGVPLLLVATEAARRAELLAGPIGRFVPVHPDVEVAMRSIGIPPRRRRDRVALPGIAASSRVARQFVRQVCHRWGIVSLAEDAAAVATELVENVIQHTASVAELRLELRADMLSVAVSDGDPHPAVLREAVTGAVPSTGLAIVTQLARAWGCMPTARGKIVWAVLRPS